MNFSAFLVILLLGISSGSCLPIEEAILPTLRGTTLYPAETNHDATHIAEYPPWLSTVMMLTPVALGATLIVLAGIRLSVTYKDKCQEGFYRWKRKHFTHDGEYNETERESAIIRRIITKKQRQNASWKNRAKDNAKFRNATAEDIAKENEEDAKRDAERFYLLDETAPLQHEESASIFSTEASPALVLTP